MLGGGSEGWKDFLRLEELQHMYVVLRGLTTPIVSGYGISPAGVGS